MLNTLFFILIFLFFGCSSKNEKELLKNLQDKKDSYYALSKTEWIKLEKVIFTIKYSPKKEQFLVGISKENFLPKFFLDKNRPLKIEKIEYKNIKETPFKISWQNYYLVSFKKIKKDKVTLKVETTLKSKEIIFFKIKNIN